MLIHMCSISGAFARSTPSETPARAKGVQKGPRIDKLHLKDLDLLERSGTHTERERERERETERERERERRKITVLTI